MGGVRLWVTHPDRATMQIPGAIIADMKNHMQACLPEEGCGLLAGNGNIIRKFVSITNELHLPTRFRMAPAEQVRALIEFEQNDLELVAITHSHPLGPPLPSPTDLAEITYPEAAALIWHQTQGDWQVRAFRIYQDRSIEELDVVITP